MPADNSLKLRGRAEKLVERLAAAGIRAALDPESLREYSIKVVLPAGRVVIFYSPNKEAFTCHPEAVQDEGLWSAVLEAWGTDRPAAAAVKAGQLAELDPAAPVDIYVDGSCVGAATAYGVVAVQKNRPVWEEAGVVVTEEVDGTRQVAGELQAVLTALDWCRAKEIKAAAIHYDYEGIRAWATGRWKAKKAVTQNYRVAVAAAGLEITWRKVTAHTGVKWNEHADQLARQKAAAAPRPAGPAPDFMIELDEAADGFAGFLRQQGLEAAVKIRAEAPVAHIQLALSQGREGWGYLNFYGGPGKTPYLRFHELKPADRKRRVEKWWEEFKTG